MKTGLLTYSSKYITCNIGDYVQSLAARQFLSGVDALVCREALDEYSGPDIGLILNGWFTHEPTRWPPSAAIHPLFVSFHINSVARPELTSEASIAYLKKWAPIGCRDHGTVELLRRAGVDAYFSGCLTLTLGRTWRRRPPDGTICFVDPYFQVKTDASSLRAYGGVLLRNFPVVRSIAQKMFGRGDIRSLLKSSAFYQAYRCVFSDEILRGAEYVVQAVAASELSDDEAKFAYAESLLTKYSSANFVVTSRIHCALPCLGIGTPVLYVENEGQAETSSCRLSGLRELLHVLTYRDDAVSCELWDGKITPEFTFANKDDHKVLADELSARCESYGRSLLELRAV